MILFFNSERKMTLYKDYFFLLGVFIFLSVFDSGSPATSLSEKIYYDLDPKGTSMCFRRFNATHQIGCSSDRGGNVGVIHLILNESDVDWLVQTGSHSPYMAVMNIHMFRRDIFDQLVKSKKVNGLIVIVDNETDVPDHFSPDTVCPNDRYGLYSGDKHYDNCKWNPFGNGMMFEDVPFPMVAVSNESDISFIIQKCYEKFNTKDVVNMPKGYSLCAMEIKDVMNGAKDTPTCHRRTNLITNLSPQGYCDPLSNYNVYSYMDKMNKSETLENGSVIMIAARLDAFSLFDNRYPGFDSAALGFVTVHAIAEALGRVKEKLLSVVQNQPIMFALLHGEAFDYIGSSRMVYDMSQNHFLPVTLESIGTFIEIGQVGLHDDSGSLWIHTDPISTNRSLDIRNRVNHLMEQIINTSMAVGLKITQAPEGNPLPPASLQQFLKSTKTSIAGILLSNHKDEFVNKYYNSIYDRSDDTSNTSDPEAYSRVTPIAAHLQKISTTIARTVYTILLGNSSDVKSVESSNVTIANLIYCFTKKSDCELLNATSEFGKSGYQDALRQNKYLSRYIGVATHETHQVTKHHMFLLAHFLGTVVENVTSAEQCQELSKKNDGYQYIFLNGQQNATDNTTRIHECVRTTANISDAMSPAFTIDGYDWSLNSYSAWTESQWDTSAMHMRVFLLPNPDQEVMTLCIGLALFAFSFVVAFLLSRQASVIFSPLH